MAHGHIRRLHSCSARWCSLERLMHTSTSNFMQLTLIKLGVLQLLLND